MTTNKELVRQLAEEIQDGEYDIMKSPFFDIAREGNIEYLSNIISKYIIPFGAKMFEEGFNLGSEYRANNPLGLLHDHQCECEMKERGLIAGKKDNPPVDGYPTKYWFVSYYRKGGPWASEFFLTKVEAEQWIIDNKYSIGSEQIHKIVRNESLGFIPKNHPAIENAIEEIRALREADEQEYNNTGKTFLDHIKGMEDEKGDNKA